MIVGAQTISHDAIERGVLPAQVADSTPTEEPAASSGAAGSSVAKKEDPIEKPQPGILRTRFRHQKSRPDVRPDMGADPVQIFFCNFLRLSTYLKNMWSVFVPIILVMPFVLNFAQVQTTQKIQKL